MATMLADDLRTHRCHAVVPSPRRLAEHDRERGSAYAGTLRAHLDNVGRGRHRGGLELHLRALAPAPPYPLGR